MIESGIIELRMGQKISKNLYIEKEKNRHIDSGAIRKRSGKERWEKRRKRVSLSRR